MDQEYIGMIRFFAGNFVPQGWLACEGQELPIYRNEALYSILANTYGGNPTVGTFALPDLRGRIPLHAASQPSPSTYPLGESAGTETVTLLTSQIPAHGHAPSVTSTNATEHIPGVNGALALAAPMDASINDTLGFSVVNTPQVAMTGSMTSTSGNNEAHSNMQPYMPFMFIICTLGIYPNKP
jgi:microcystin-dependent protein